MTTDQFAKRPRRDGASLLSDVVVDRSSVSAASTAHRYAPRFPNLSGAVGRALLRATSTDRRPRTDASVARRARPRVPSSTPRAGACAGARAETAKGFAEIGSEMVDEDKALDGTKFVVS